MAVVEQRLALPVDGELPEGFAVPGLRIASGVLPRREEAAVTVRVLDWRVPPGRAPSCPPPLRS